MPAQVLKFTCKFCGKKVRSQKLRTKHAKDCKE